MNAEHLRKYIITPTLKQLGYYSPEAVELLVLTTAQESHCGKYLHQINGPAIGIYQMEPRTHDDLWDNFLKYRQELSDKVRKLILPSKALAVQMAGNLYYATAMARVHYLRWPEALPECGDVKGMARYYKTYYNTPLGAATVEEAISNYQKFA